MRSRAPAALLLVATILAGCEFASATPAPSFAAPASPSATAAPSASSAAPTGLALPSDVAMWCREHVEDVYAVTEGLGIPSDPRPFRLEPEDDDRWAPVEGSRNYQVGCAAAWQERASPAP